MPSYTSLLFIDFIVASYNLMLEEKFIKFDRHVASTYLIALKGLVMSNNIK
ncbi:hypothetical protein [Saccharolobus caldissimus]|uniref:hypothetical protein n=1 Tax=Saccharolobus caldissimus TaxID=1702097 RepID=UPI001E5AF9A4|nr:hypothetical protein [Saccharolobus caldissimus]